MVGKLNSGELVAGILARAATTENTDTFESGGEKSFHKRKIEVQGKRNGFGVWGGAQM